MAIDITNENFVQEIEQSTLPVIIDVFATWCGPCQQVAPLFDELEQEFKGKVKFAKINVDQARELSIKFGVSSVPTFILLKNGAVIDRQTGYTSKEDLRAKVQSLLS